jgi:hypothetical protein
MRASNAELPSVFDLPKYSSVLGVKKTSDWLDNPMCYTFPLKRGDAFSGFADYMYGSKPKIPTLDEYLFGKQE